MRTMAEQEGRAFAGDDPAIVARTQRIFDSLTAARDDIRQLALEAQAQGARTCRRAA